jgi:Fic family protein
MQRALLGEPEDTQKHGWRNEQVWIGGGISPHTAEFVPPVHGRIQHFIDDLMRFIDRDDLPVLAQIAIAHAQFETIHPFVDGNGRTGRALVQSLLRAKGVTVSTTVPLSAGLLNEAAQ